MKLIGTFYLTNGCTHKEVFKVPRKDKKDALQFVETLYSMYERKNEEDGYIQFGHFACLLSNIVGFRIEQK